MLLLTPGASGARAAPVQLPDDPTISSRLPHVVLQALQGYYYDGEARLTDEEFENLKDDLIWNGSKIAVLSSNEQRFLEATISHSRGKPILTDEEYDELKGELIKSNSVVTRAGPRCSIRSRRMYSDAIPDYLRLTALNLPAALLVLGAIFSIDDLTGFEITKAIELPPPYSILFLWGLCVPHHLRCCIKPHQPGVARCAHPQGGLP